MTNKSKRVSVPRVIDGGAYVVTLIPRVGYGVVANDNPVDRISRSYLVPVNHDGVTERCSCPHQFHRGGVCKHMKEVQRVMVEAALHYLATVGKKYATALGPDHPAVETLRRVYARLRKTGYQANLPPRTVCRFAMRSVANQLSPDDRRTLGHKEAK